MAVCQNKPDCTYAAENTCPSCHLSFCNAHTDSSGFCLWCAGAAHEAEEAERAKWEGYYDAQKFRVD